MTSAGPVASILPDFLQFVQVQLFELAHQCGDVIARRDGLGPERRDVAEVREQVECDECGGLSVLGFLISRPHALQRVFDLNDRAIHQEAYRQR